MPTTLAVMNCRTFSRASGLGECGWPLHTFALASARASAAVRPFHGFNVVRVFVHKGIPLLVAVVSKIPRLLPSVQMEVMIRAQTSDLRSVWNPTDDCAPHTDSSQPRLPHSRFPRRLRTVSTPMKIRATRICWTAPARFPYKTVFKRFDKPAKHACRRPKHACYHRTVLPIANQFVQTVNRIADFAELDEVRFLQ
jgi:hypothetical protein